MGSSNVRGRAAPRTIVVASTDVEIVDRFVRALEESGHRVRHVDAIVSLFEAFDGAPPPTDLILLDCRLLDQVRPDAHNHTERDMKPHTGAVPVVAFSGTVGGASVVRRLADLGITQFINEHTASDSIVPALTPRLFPQSFDRRTSTRIVFSVPITYRFADTIATALTLDLAKGGIGVRTIAPLEVGTQVRLTFRLPEGREDRDAHARVVWSDRLTGMGLQFETIGTTDQTAIDEFVDRRHRHEAPDSARAGKRTSTQADSRPGSP